MSGIRTACPRRAADAACGLDEIVLASTGAAVPFPGQQFAAGLFRVWELTG